MSARSIGAHAAARNTPIAVHPVFLFGTLRHRPLLDVVLGSSAHLEFSATELAGYRLSRAKDGPFPVISVCEAGHVTGTCVTGLTAQDLARLDFYEAAFGYRMSEVTLTDGRRTRAYFPGQERAAPTDTAWTLDDWVHDWAPLSMRAAQEIMGYQDRKTPEQLARMFPMIRARAWSQLNAAKSVHDEDAFDGDVVVAVRRREHADYFALDSYDLRHARFDGGMSPEVHREVFVATDAALVLPYDARRDRVLLVEQMRMGPLARGDAKRWQLEPIAGRIDPGETPQATARREALEEAGLRLGALETVAETYCSPGASSEFYYIFLGQADLPDNVPGTGGLDVENEDIRTHLMSFDRLMELCNAQRLANLPLVMLAYWLAQNRTRLRAAANTLN